MHQIVELPLIFSIFLAPKIYIHFRHQGATVFINTVESVPFFLNRPVYHLTILYSARQIYRCFGRYLPYIGEKVPSVNVHRYNKHTYIRSFTVMEMMTREKCGILVIPRTVPVEHVMLSVHCAGKSLSRQRPVCYVKNSET